eukprot:GHVU01115143.1.p1 GENE.GHVU01115143.1~~GHVU01115143.1.p1  ORF type:complete len:561 (+),score=83.89 GHVU01115143.1:154-1683(+)
MTQEKCMAHCKGNDYRMAGLSYYGICYCGQTVSTPLLAETECNLPCNGNSSQTCGGENSISLWMDPTFEELSGKTIDEYVPVGCWTDESTDGGRAVFFRQDSLSADTMTNQLCLTQCLKKGMPFAGTEYAGECYCGVVLGNGTAIAEDQSTCNMPCNGDKTQTCGGSGRINLYVAKDLQSLEPCGYVAPVVSSTTTITATSVPTSTKTSTTTSTSTKPPATCTSTVVVPPTCEYGCGNWCSSPLPDFADEKNCLTAWSQCKIQVASCFINAGWPDAMDCFNFGEWCGKVKEYCSISKGKNGKNGCFKSSPPRGGKPATTTTTTFPCSATSAVPTTSTTTTPVPIPTPTGVCKQPTNKKYGYGVGNPVGGIELPLVTCNNIQTEWKAGKIFKLYTHSDSRKCRSYKRSDCKGACEDSCLAQYNECKDIYAEGCRTKGRSGGKNYGSGYSSVSRRSYFDETAMSKRTFDRFNQDYDSAKNACRVQYYDCVDENKSVRDNNTCKTFAGDWVN